MAVDPPRYRRPRRVRRCRRWRTSHACSRVVPLHSFKFAATMQDSIGSLPQQKNPLLIRIEVKAGHGAGKPTSKIIDEAADIYTFIAIALKLV